MVRRHNHTGGHRHSGRKTRKVQAYEPEPFVKLNHRKRRRSSSRKPAHHHHHSSIEQDVKHESHKRVNKKIKASLRASSGKKKHPHKKHHPHKKPSSKRKSYRSRLDGEEEIVTDELEKAMNLRMEVENRERVLQNLVRNAAGRAEVHMETAIEQIDAAHDFINSNRRNSHKNAARNSALENQLANNAQNIAQLANKINNRSNGRMNNRELYNEIESTLRD
jgi:hypothetical protein